MLHSTKQPKNDEKELKRMLVYNNFKHPLFIDQEKEIDKINKFPSNPEYQCFLLDKDNKVVLVGNPILFSEIWKLYKMVINESEETVLTMKYF